MLRMKDFPFALRNSVMTTQIPGAKSNSCWSRSICFFFFVRKRKNICTRIIQFWTWNKKKLKWNLKSRKQKIADFIIDTEIRNFHEESVASAQQILFGQFWNRKNKNCGLELDVKNRQNTLTKRRSDGATSARPTVTIASSESPACSCNYTKWKLDRYVKISTVSAWNNACKQAVLRSKT